MSIKIQSTEVFNSDGKATNMIINIGCYTTAELQSGSYDGIGVGSFTFCSNTKTIVYWNGTEWDI